MRKQKQLSPAQRLSLAALKAHRTRREQAAKSARNRATKRELLASVRAYDKRIAAFA